MPDLLTEPITSESVDSARSLQLGPRAAYLFSFSAEDRSRLAPDWMQRNADTRFVELVPEEATRASFSWHAEGVSGKVRLRSERDLDDFVGTVQRDLVYVDIT